MRYKDTVVDIPYGSLINAMNICYMLLEGMWKTVYF